MPNIVSISERVTYHRDADALALLRGDARALLLRNVREFNLYGMRVRVVRHHWIVRIFWTLIAGSYKQLPRVALVDVLPILGNKDVLQVSADSLPSIPRRAMALLNGRNVENFRSRSEAEQSLIASLVNPGHSFESVLELFLRYPCAGKFAELRRRSEANAIRWLRRSYDKATQWTSKTDSKIRQTIAAMRDYGLDVGYDVMKNVDIITIKSGLKAKATIML